MGIRIDLGTCMPCELTCGYHRDDAFAMLSSSTIAYRARELKDYFGVMLKDEKRLWLSPGPRAWRSSASGPWRSRGRIRPTSQPSPYSSCASPATSALTWPRDPCASASARSTPPTRLRERTIMSYLASDHVAIIDLISGGVEELPLDEGLLAACIGGAGANAALRAAHAEGESLVLPRGS